MTTPVPSRRGDPAPPPEYRDFEVLAQDLLALRVSCLNQASSPEKLIERLDAVAARLPMAELEIAGARAERAEAMIHLGLLVKCYPVGVQDAKVFGRLLIDDVMALEPQSAAVAIACRRCRLKHNFMPSIAEVVTELRGTISLVTSALEFAGRIRAERDRLAADR
ncbi:hypothetical protein DYI24_00275 [Rhodopseudomonas sp. BR0C11]|uniref:hypothetical protein n=1 Tax=Rhodopseudomonas sp. BR0C11 TaxID=2269370 RepID=UPI0013DF685D|nr:hypothetical protein [Rhodopseudomonas sp. BR0C11]NEV75517.1 hypothetical protein [Rhodopseudomonas sp. BR0C11]